jgi:hypothetical protein
MSLIFCQLFGRKLRIPVATHTNLGNNKKLLQAMAKFQHLNFAQTHSTIYYIWNSKLEIWTKF